MKKIDSTEVKCKTAKVPYHSAGVITLLHPYILINKLLARDCEFQRTIIISYSRPRFSYFTGIFQFSPQLRVVAAVCVIDYSKRSRNSGNFSPIPTSLRIHDLYNTLYIGRTAITQRRMFNFERRASIGG